MLQRIILTAFLLIVSVVASLVLPGDGWSVEPGFKQYTDSSRRFILDYPATMTVSEPEAGRGVTIYHPKVSFSIRILVEERPRKTVADAKIGRASCRERV